MRSAVLGASASNALTAALVRERARCSSTWPRSTSVVMAAAASKYSGAAPFILNAAGSSSGQSSATTLKSQAVPVPRPIKLNMLRCQVRNETQARAKNGHPAHSTTGVPSAPCDQLNKAMPSQRCRLRPGTNSPIVTNSNGSVSAALTHRRRVMSSSSAVSASGSMSRGSSAMPHFGQLPGPIWRISGCMGQVKTTPARPTATVDFG